MSGVAPHWTASPASRLKYAGFRLAALAVAHLPAWLAYDAAVPIGALAASLTPTRRANVIDNLSHVLVESPQPMLLRLSTMVYQSVTRYYVDLFRMPSNRVDDLREKRVRAIGLEHLTRAVAEGHGVIVATMHFGAPEMALQAARAWGLRFVVLTEPLQPPELAELFTRLRSAHGHQLVPAGVGGLKVTLRTLRAGGAVLLVVDRDIQGNGVVVPFFGTHTRMPAGAVELARATGASIIVAVSRRLRDGRTEVVFEPPLALVNTGNRRRDLQANVARLAARFEPHIRRTPEQWLVLDRIWRPAP